ncbi:MAG: serine/threonine protein kinase [Planctomycetota bacterium]|jgi:serine/threonine-protein kinase
MIDLTDATINGLTFHRQLSKGHRGETYAATIADSGQRVAAKLLQPPYDDCRLVHLATKACASVHHEDIVPCLGVRRLRLPDGQRRLTIISELVDGSTIGELIEDGALPLVSGLWLVAQAASCLAVAHQAGLVHGALKPSSLLVHRSGHVKIVGFGMPAPDADNGCIAYTAPELHYGESPSIASDCYALAAILYQVIDGAPPYHHHNRNRVRHQHIHSPIPRVACPQVPELNDILQQHLAKSPSERATDTKLLADNLRTLAEQAPIGSSSSSHLPIVA